DELSDTAQRAYRALVWEDADFGRFFHAFTPIDELAYLEIGSRPIARPEAGGPHELERLRAIPWVFAWTQNRCLLPAWYGAGTALSSADVDDLRRLYRAWPCFRALVDNLEMTLAKSSMEIARWYLELVEPDLGRRMFATIEEEHERAVGAVLALTESNRLVQRHATLQRSIQLRNPYVDPMNAVQVALLTRYRAGDQDALRPLLRSIANIATALRNTG